MSAHEGIAKPDPEIFRRLSGALRTAAERTVMIDDSEANLEAARDLGMQTVHFRSAAKLRGWLTAAGLLGPDGARDHVTAVLRPGRPWVRPS